jgi:hypothetical protein
MVASHNDQASSALVRTRTLTTSLLGYRSERYLPRLPGQRYDNVTTHPSAHDTVQGRHADLADRDLLPDVHLVDSGYVSVGQVLSAADDHGVALTGPLPPDTSWQAGDDTAFDLTRFAIDWDARHVVCPPGKISRNWQPARSRDGLPVIRATFRQPDCRPAPTGHDARDHRTTPGT